MTRLHQHKPQASLRNSMTRPSIARRKSGDSLEGTIASGCGRNGKNLREMLQQQQHHLQKQLHLLSEKKDDDLGFSVQASIDTCNAATTGDVNNMQGQHGSHSSNCLISGETGELNCKEKCSITVTPSVRKLPFKMKSFDGISEISSSSSRITTSELMSSNGLQHLIASLNPKQVPSTDEKIVVSSKCNKVFSTPCNSGSLTKRLNTCDSSSICHYKHTKRHINNPNKKSNCSNVIASDCHISNESDVASGCLKPFRKPLPVFAKDSAAQDLSIKNRSHVKQMQPFNVKRLSCLKSKHRLSKMKQCQSDLSLMVQLSDEATQELPGDGSSHSSAANFSFPMQLLSFANLSSADQALSTLRPGGDSSKLCNMESVIEVVKTSSSFPSKENSAVMLDRTDPTPRMKKIFLPLLHEENSNLDGDTEISQSESLIFSSSPAQGQAVHHAVSPTGSKMIASSILSSELTNLCSGLSLTQALVDHPTDFLSYKNLIAAPKEDIIVKKENSLSNSCDDVRGDVRSVDDMKTVTDSCCSESLSPISDLQPSIEDPRANCLSIDLVSVAAQHLTVSLSAHLRNVSSDGQIKLVFVKQPERQHRARYLTEGSRGAVKDQEGSGHPIIEVQGTCRPCIIQVFVGSDNGHVAPHLYYQACQVVSKTVTGITERKIRGTTVIEVPLTMHMKMKLCCDCVGILKERYVDVEQRRGGLATAKSRKSTKCRLVFRAAVERENGSVEVLQIASLPISCTQPPGVPEILRQSLSHCSASQQPDLFIIGKHFQKDSKVVFQQKKGLSCDDVDEDIVLWARTVTPDVDALHSTHLICKVPLYNYTRLAAGQSSEVSMLVVSAGKSSEPHSFTFISDDDHFLDTNTKTARAVANTNECSVALQTSVSAEDISASELHLPNRLKILSSISKDALLINREFSATGTYQPQVAVSCHKQQSLSAATLASLSALLPKLHQLNEEQLDVLKFLVDGLIISKSGASHLVSTMQKLILSSQESNPPSEDVNASLNCDQHVIIDESNCSAIAQDVKQVKHFQSVSNTNVAVKHADAQNRHTSIGNFLQSKVSKPVLMDCNSARIDVDVLPKHRHSNKMNTSTLNFTSGQVSLHGKLFYNDLNSSQDKPCYNALPHSQDVVMKPALHGSSFREQLMDTAQGNTLLVDKHPYNEMISPGHLPCSTPSSVSCIDVHTQLKPCEANFSGMKRGGTYMGQSHELPTVAGLNTLVKLESAEERINRAVSTVPKETFTISSPSVLQESFIAASPASLRSNPTKINSNISTFIKYNSLQSSSFPDVNASFRKDADSFKNDSAAQKMNDVSAVVYGTDVCGHSASVSLQESYEPTQVTFKGNLVSTNNCVDPSFETHPSLRLNMQSSKQQSSLKNSKSLVDLQKYLCPSTVNSVMSNNSNVSANLDELVTSNPADNFNVTNNVIAAEDPETMQFSSSNHGNSSYQEQASNTQSAATLTVDSTDLTNNHYLDCFTSTNSKDHLTLTQSIKFISSPTSFNSANIPFSDTQDPSYKLNSNKSHSTFISQEEPQIGQQHKKNVDQSYKSQFQQVHCGSSNYSSNPSNSDVQMRTLPAQVQPMQHSRQMAADATIVLTAPMKMLGVCESVQLVNEEMQQMQTKLDFQRQENLQQQHNMLQEQHQLLLQQYQQPQQQQLTVLQSEIHHDQSIGSPATTLMHTKLGAPTATRSALTLARDPCLQGLQEQQQTAIPLSDQHNIVPSTPSVMSSLQGSVMASMESSSMGEMHQVQQDQLSHEHLQEQHQDMQGLQLHQQENDLSCQHLNLHLNSELTSSLNMDQQTDQTFNSVKNSALVSQNDPLLSQFNTSMDNWSSNYSHISNAMPKELGCTDSLSSLHEPYIMMQADSYTAGSSSTT